MWGHGGCGHWALAGEQSAGEGDKDYDIQYMQVYIIIVVVS